MGKAPKSLRPHIAIFGRRNVGKSSILNQLTGQQVSIVSAVAGTTTDPVEKPMELYPVGPVLFIDTAGVDDDGPIGDLRIRKTRQVLERADVGVIVTEGSGLGEFESSLVDELSSRGLPIIVLWNKADLKRPDENIIKKITTPKIKHIITSTKTGEGIDEYRNALIASIPEIFLKENRLVSDLIKPSELCVLVVPINLQAPRGRLLQVQVHVLRELLDNGSYSMVVRNHELGAALSWLSRPPALVVTDSQAFELVAKAVPEEIPLTSFSILMARFKGDLDEFVRGARKLDDLKPGDDILIEEACTHHPITDDIGRVKIPRWLNSHVGGRLNFAHMQGHDFPDNVDGYDMIIHCGACMLNRQQVLSRVLCCRKAGVPITNYGLAIAHILGIMDRVLKPFNKGKA